MTISGFLAPLNDTRARDVLGKLSRCVSAAGYLAVLSESYPMVFGQMEQKSLECGALVLEMTGADMGEALVFVSHLDVSEPCELTPTKEPFSAPLERAHVVALLEALEALLGEGYRPSGDLYIALSADGASKGLGAKSINHYLAARGVTPCFVLDFGGYVSQSTLRTYLPGNAPLALVGVTEKTRLQGALVCEKTASRRREPLRAVLRAGARLSYKTKSATLCEATRLTLRAMYPAAPIPQKWLARFPRLSYPLVRLFWRKRAMFRQFFTSELTLMSVTQSGEAGRAPQSAQLNFTLTALPGKTIEGIKRRLSLLSMSRDCKLRYDVEMEASPLSEPSGAAWNALKTAIEILYDRVVVAPCVSPYLTDGRFYAGLRGNVYRFSPFLLGAQEAEKGLCTISEGSLQTAVQFFRQMLSV